MMGVLVASSAMLVTVRKCGASLPSRPFDREVLLVVAHDGDEDLFGEFEVGGLEAAEEDVGPLGEVGDGVDEGLVLAPACAGDGAGDVVESLADFVAAGFDVGEDVLAF